MNTMKVIRFLSASAGLLSVLMFSSCMPLVIQPYSPQYYSPLQNAEYVSTGATIVVRYGPVLSDQNLVDLKFSVRGSKSGLHAGQTILADDHKTVIFKPANPFTPGEQVMVDINSLLLDWQTIFRPLSYTFTVAINQRSGSPVSLSAEPPTSAPRSAFPNFLTLPQDIPHYTVSKTSPDAGDGHIFVSPFYWYCPSFSLMRLLNFDWSAYPREHKLCRSRVRKWTGKRSIVLINAVDTTGFRFDRAKWSKMALVGRLASK
jgi:hypothetical protein